MRALAGWPAVPSGGEVYDAVAHIVAELAANAVTHARVPGWGFELRLILAASANILRIEVSDARTGSAPRRRRSSGEDESGRGLLLIEALAAAWGIEHHAIGKTVWADVSLTS
ncbi:ATP-binding protein [Streptomyces sp. CAU 1734]|uniref:ATP-binding protein n=1 Tax=Streptomyces sp. CAU 1734 TaxID=3140360 RepID=UPI003260F561